VYSEFFEFEQVGMFLTVIYISAAKWPSFWMKFVLFYHSTATVSYHTQQNCILRAKDEVMHD
jgi:hypothetical protein